MDYKKFEDKYILRLNKGDEILESLESLVKKENIRLASVTGIGALGKAEIGLFNSRKKKYFSKVFQEDMEIVSLNGNISEMNGEPYLHLHIALADESLKLVGGHLNYGLISLTGEIIVDTIKGEIDREFDEEVGLNLIKF